MCSRSIITGRLSIGAKINDLGWPWTADTYSVAEKMRLSVPTTKIWMTIDYLWQKCKPMTLVSGGIRIMRIFVEVLWGGGVKRQWGCRKWQFSAISIAIFSDTLVMMPALLYGDMQLCSLSSAFQWSQNAWPWMTLNGYFVLNSVKINKDRHILSAVQIFGRDSSFWQYEVCADVRSGSLEKKTLKGSGVAR